MGETVTQKGKAIADVVATLTCAATDPARALTRPQTMPSPPMVSVIVPAYNASATVEETLRSALAQTLREIEVLVVDDGSTDGTASVVERVAEGDSRVRLIRQENAGVAAARNAAIAASRGRYVAPLDADDVWYPEKLAAQVARMERGGAGMGMVYTWMVLMDEDSRVFGEAFPCRAEGDLYLPLVYVNFLGCASVPLFRRSALDAVGGYDPTLRARGGEGCEDWDISLRVAAEYAVGCAPGHLVGYRDGPTSMSHNIGGMARSYDLVMERVRRERPGVPDAVLRWSESNFRGYLAAQSFALGRYRDTLRLLTEAVAADPGRLTGTYSVKLAARSVVGAAGVAARGGAFAALGLEARARAGWGERRETTREAVERDWAARATSMPWADSWRPANVLRSRRWRRLLRTPTPPAVGVGRSAPERPSPRPAVAASRG